MDALAQLRVSLAGRYTIEREIGRGGMATVYLARDIKHTRRVALKLLNPEVGAVLGVERFLAEIRVTANLQHPHLLPLFDSGDADGLLYYVMPYVDGESLRSKLSRERQLPIDEAIHLASAVASALEYTHRHGVIHRDLKPENILLHEGQPLIADFGIALAISNAAGDRITQTGLSLGTPEYMSPEQATGDRMIDGRTDVYSLGALTYEMLTGEPPHTGRTAQAVIARILTEPVRSIRSSRASVPPHVEAAVMRALEKLPADRWPTAHELADALAGRGAPVTIPHRVRTASTLPHSGEDARGGFVGRRVVMTTGPFVAAVALAVMATWYIGARTRTAEGRPSVSFVIDPPIYEGVRQTIIDFAISPDGGTLALLAYPFAESNAHAYLRRLSEPAASLIPGTEGATYAAYSPDGKWLSITTISGKLLKVRVDGTSVPITLADGVDGYNGAVWPDNETIVLGNARPNRLGLGRIAATGGAVRPLTTPKSAGETHGFPFVAPDGRTVLFDSWGPGFTEDDFLAIGSLETGAFQTSALLASRPYGVVEGRALYAFGTSIMAVPIDAKRLRVTGDPVRVLEDVTLDGKRSAALSAGGTLAYRRGQPGSRLLLVDRDGRTQTLSSDEHFIYPYGDGPRFSPDGQRIAVAVWGPSGDTAAADIWTFDLARRAFSRVSSLGTVIEPDWTTDGKRVVFTTWYPRKAALWVQVADGSQPAERLFQAPDGIGIFHSSVTPDGHGVVFCRSSATGAVAGVELLYLPFAGERTPQRLTDEPLSDNCLGRVSPDGKWLAYVGTEVGTSQVFVRRFHDGGGRLKVSEGNGQQPTWSRDGKRLFYTSAAPIDGKMWAVAATVAATGNSLHVVNRERVATLPSAMFDVTPDGNRILAVQPSDSRVQLFVATNWLPQLRARLAGRQ
jgi:serine/threonine-protein kinase